MHIIKYYYSGMNDVVEHNPEIYGPIIAYGQSHQCDLCGCAANGECRIPIKWHFLFGI